MRDEDKHVIGGTVGLVFMVICFKIFHAYGLPAALFAAGAVLGVGVEVYQKLRNDGDPTMSDALLTAFPAWGLALVLKIAGVNGF